MTNTAAIIDGKAIAAQLRTQIAARVESHSRSLRTPGLAVVLVGDDQASAVYVRSKEKQTVEAGMASFIYRLPATESCESLLELVASLNADPAVDGILVQLPLPTHIDENKVLRSIAVEKDVDGFNPLNVGLVATGAGGLVPCTPKGAIQLLKSFRPDLTGLHAVVLGRSNIVGKPMAQLLLAENCTVSVAHSRTVNLPDLVRSADILIAAVGRPHFVRGPWIKPGAIVIDVGINRVKDEAGHHRLLGDVAFDEVASVAGAITPVPGGVGPMTIACLLGNTLEAFERSFKL